LDRKILGKFEALQLQFAAAVKILKFSMENWPDVLYLGMCHTDPFCQVGFVTRDSVQISTCQVPTVTRDRQINQNCTVYDIKKISADQVSVHEIFAYIVKRQMFSC
jgi:hypothetical protein